VVSVRDTNPLAMLQAMERLGSTGNQGKRRIYATLARFAVAAVSIG
jgi:hypothetical protein